MKSNKLQKNQQKSKNNKFLITFVCIFMSVVLIFGATLGIISAVKKSKSIVWYKGQTMDVETASFFASYYKYVYMSALSKSGVSGVEDSPGFWNSDAGNGKKYKDLLLEGAQEYIKQIVVVNYLYDRYTRLTAGEKERISAAVDDIITYKANGDRKEFNTLVKEFGFSYSSFRKGAEMLYKASTAKGLIYGENGENVAKFTDLAEEYLAEYSHVKLLFIRTSDKFVYENGQRVVGKDGNYLLEALTSEEIADRQKTISEVRASISAIGSGVGVEMNGEMFDYYLKNHDEGDEDMRGDGYYFSKRSSYTSEFSTVFADIVNKSYEMQVGTFSEVAVDFGVCFIYKTEPTEGAYSLSASNPCFEDFYSDAASFLFEKNITQLSAEVALDEKFLEIDLTTLPYNYAYLPNF